MTGRPVEFGDSELTPYVKRHFSSLGIWQAGKFRVKVTAIRCEPGDMRTELKQKAQKFVNLRLPELAEREGDHHNLGFVVIHQGKDATWLLMHWWAHGEICCQELAAAVGEGEFRTVEAPFHACVWEHLAINHEHQAWVRTMLTSVPSADTYLADVMAEDEY